MAKKVPEELSLPEIQALHDRLTDHDFYAEGKVKTCPRCLTTLVLNAAFCHHCGRRVDATSSETASLPVQLVTVKLHGLYDEKRREELALALIPVLADLSRTIDMSDVEHIDIAALTSLVPLLETRERERSHPIDVIGMNDGVYKALQRAGFDKFFTRI